MQCYISATVAMISTMIKDLKDAEVSITTKFLFNSPV